MKLNWRLWQSEANKDAVTRGNVVNKPVAGKDARAMKAAVAKSRANDRRKPPYSQN